MNRARSSPFEIISGEDPIRSSEQRRAARAFGQILGPWDVYRLLWPVASRLSNERAWSVVLDFHQWLLGYETIGIGERTHVDFNLVRLYRPAQIADSRYLTLVHNHVTGDAQPSEDDRKLTYEAWEGARRSGLMLVDHVILAENQFYSFAARRWRGDLYHVKAA